eukprot:6191544-Pleurochrysis_carterae.AAC.1
MHAYIPSYQPTAPSSVCSLSMRLLARARARRRAARVLRLRATLVPRAQTCGSCTRTRTRRRRGDSARRSRSTSPRASTSQTPS